jgi:hypothetical protein
VRGDWWERDRCWLLVERSMNAKRAKKIAQGFSPG